MAPGDRLITWASRFCSRDMMERLVHPIVSDVRLEYHDALSQDARWRARWALLGGYVTFLKALALHALANFTLRLARRTLAIALAGAAIPLVGWVAATAAWNADFGLLFLSGPAGGLLIAALLLRKRSMDAHSAFNPDPFRRDFDTLNFAHVRVAGFGGAGLLLAAFVVALQFPLTTVAVLCGVVGGAVLGVTLIQHRRRA